MKKEKLKEYLAPKMEVFQFALEKGFAVSPELKGDSDGLGKKEVQDPRNSNVGQFEEGANWTNSEWNETGWN